MLLVSSTAFSQLYNVDSYCVDEIPFEAGTCDIYGEEYSTIELDLDNNKVAVFFGEELVEYEVKSIEWNGENQYHKYTMVSDGGDKIIMLSTKDKGRFILSYLEFSITFKTSPGK